MGLMANKMIAGQPRGAADGYIWGKACALLRVELGEASFQSYLAPAVIVASADGALSLVAHTGVARDWIRRNAWVRINELWAAHDVEGRALVLKTRLEAEAELNRAPARSDSIETAEPVSIDIPAPAIGGRGRGPGGLQDRFTFDSFVVGPSNEFAHAVARRVASWADGHFNPVIFHGPFGFGKTHLVSALAWAAMEAEPDRKVIYMTAERFLTSFLRALADRTVDAFKAELRSADLLVIEDVHFIGGKQSTQEELFHTLAALMEDGRRVVFSSDRPPSAINELDARLRSHLSAGLVCGIEPADRTLRLGILERKLAVLSRQQGAAAVAKPEVLQFIADRFSENVRELEGALNTLVMRAGAKLSTMTVDEAQAWLRPHLRGSEKKITVDEIQKVTAEHFGLRQADLVSERRTRSVARPRQAAMWIAKQITTRSLPDIGRRFGGRDHTTVLHAVRRIEQLRADDPQLARDLEAVMRKLRG